MGRQGEVKSKKLTKEQEYKKALEAIASFGSNIPDDKRDYANIGKNAIYQAKQALAEKCKECGKVK